MRRPSFLVLLVTGLGAITASVASSDGAGWFVHAGLPTDAALFFAMAHDHDFGVTRLTALHIPVGLAYRYQRILYPLAARLLGLFQQGLAAAGLVAANVLAAAVGTEVLSRWATRHGASMAWGWLFAGSLGLLVAFFFDLSEGLLWALLLAGLLCHAERRLPATAALLALALFTKETALIVVVVLGCEAVLMRNWNHVAWLSLPVLLFAAYQGLLLLWFGQIGLVGSHAQVGLVPFLGAYTEPSGSGLPPKHLGELLYLTVTVVAPAVAAFCWSLWRLRRGYDAVTVALLLTCLQVALMSSWSWTGFIHYARLSMGVPLLVTWIALRAPARQLRFAVILQAVVALAALPFILIGS